MEDAILADDPAWQTWMLCKSVLRRFNYSLKFPKNTDPRKTYQWRYVSRLSSKFAEWGFDKGTAKVFLEIAARHLGPENLRKNGLGCFFCNGLMEKVYKELETCEVDQQKTLEAIKSSHEFRLSKANSGHKLLGTDNGQFNIVTWFTGNRLSPAYLAVSKSCQQAIAALYDMNSVQADSLPTRTQLHAKRRSITTDNDFVKSIKKIIGEDWKSC